MTNLKTVDYTKAEVRDLAWVLLSPGLMKTSADDARLVTDTWCQQTYATHEDDLRKLDENPEPLLDYLSDLKSHRLGFYFEALLAFWLEHILQTHPFRNNVPVYGKSKDAGRRTLGEFDFLFGQKNQSVLEHWEATVKFYLYHENTIGDPIWFGPAGQDRLDIKLARMVEHQLKLAETPAGAAVIEHFSLLPVETSAFIKGYLFYPADWEGSARSAEYFSKPYPSFEISPEHLRGWWLRYGEATLPKRCVDSRWLPLPKLRWLSSAYCADEESAMLLDDAQVMKYCALHNENNGSSLLLAEMQPDLNGWFEVSRGFVVASSWPVVDR